MVASINFTTICCLIVALCSVFCLGQTWRPQGRFGKRLSPPEEAAVPDFGLSFAHDIPVEAFFSIKDIAQLRSKPRLCSVTGLHGYPLCDMLTLATAAASAGEADEWSNTFDV